MVSEEEKQDAYRQKLYAEEQKKIREQHRKEEQKVRFQERQRLINQIYDTISGNPIWQKIVLMLLEMVKEKKTEPQKEESLEEQFQKFLEWKKQRGELNE